MKSNVTKKPNADHRITSLEERVTRLEAQSRQIMEAIGTLTDCNSAIVRGLAKLEDGLASQEQRMRDAVVGALRVELLELRKEIRTVPCRLGEVKDGECDAGEVGRLRLPGGVNA